MRPQEGGRYDGGAIAFHWMVAALVLLNLALGILHEHVPGPVRVAMIGLHKSVGLTILALTVLRIGWRIGHRAPPLPGDVPPWDRVLARVSHVLLYAFTLALPLTGWWMAGGANPHPVRWFGLVTIPTFPVRAGADGAHAAHVVMGWAMLALAALHIAGALRHQRLLRDGLIRRMWPTAASR